MTFYEKLDQAITDNNSLLCIWFDPDVSKIPWWATGIYDFCVWIADQTHDLVCAYKPQIAHFAAVAAEDQLTRLIRYITEKYPNIPIILDHKRWDIGTTAEHYATEAFERYGADAATVNPYLGDDSITPYLEYTDKGVIVLCKTSNPSGWRFQNLVDSTTGEKLYQNIARVAATEWNTSNQIALVVWATYPAELAEVRKIVWDDMPLLVPGIGAQWGDIEASVMAWKNSKWRGMIINSSRAILYPKKGTPRDEALKTRDDINKYR